MAPEVGVQRDSGCNGEEGDRRLHRSLEIGENENHDARPKIRCGSDSAAAAGIARGRSSPEDEHPEDRKKGKNAEGKPHKSENLVKRTGKDQQRSYCPLHADGSRRDLIPWMNAGDRSEEMAILGHSVVDAGSENDKSAQRGKQRKGNEY